MIHKRCTTCGQTKPVSEFGPRGGGERGIRARCKECTRIHFREYRAAHPDRSKAATAKWYAANTESALAYSAKYRAENPDKRRAACARWKRENPEMVRADSAKYRATHREEIRLYAARYRAENLDSVKDRDARWKTENPEKRRAAESRRRARKQKALGTATADQIVARWEVYGGTCWICGKRAEVTDHVIPLAAGGTNWPANLRPACNHCNSIKGAIWPYDFVAARQELRA